jgi:hypothetical protein
MSHIGEQLALVVVPLLKHEALMVVVHQKYDAADATVSKVVIA